LMSLRTRPMNSILAGSPWIRVRLV
jgi:hypothetical protein